MAIGKDDEYKTVRILAFSLLMVGREKASMSSLTLQRVLSSLSKVVKRDPCWLALLLSVLHCDLDRVLVYSVQLSLI